MYWIAILAVIISAVLNMATGAGFQGVARYFDAVSLLLILILVLPILVSAGLLKDFFHSFALVIGKHKAESMSELNRCVTAVKTAIKTSLAGGGFLVLCCVIQILMTLNDPLLLGPNVAVAILTMIYALVLVLLLIPIQARLEILKQEYLLQDE